MDEELESTCNNIRCKIFTKTNGEVNISYENTTMVVWIYDGYLKAKNNYMFRPIAVIFRLLQFCSKSIMYLPILRDDHHRYASRSFYLVGSLMVNDSQDVSFMGRYQGAGSSLGAVIIGCVVYGIHLGCGCITSQYRHIYDIL